MTLRYERLRGPDHPLGSAPSAGSEPLGDPPGPAPDRAAVDPGADSRRRQPVSRRSVLRAVGLGGATVLVASTGLLSYRVYDNGVLSAGEGRPYEPWDSWRDDPSPLGAVAAAVLAANPHNTQPWIFAVGAERIDVYADGSRRMPTVDPFDRELQIGVGCALENLVLGLRARGFQPEVAPRPDPGDPSHLASVTLTAGATPSASELYEAIGDRHTDRGPYRAEPIAGAVLAELGRSDDLPEVGVTWLDTSVERAAFGSLLVAATEAIVADRQQSEEAFGWFRASRDKIEQHRDGLTLDGQGFGPVKLAVAKLLPASGRTEGDAFWLDQTRTVHTATAAAYGIVTVPDVDDVSARLAGGRLLQRIQLRATALGLGLQPMNQLTERIDRDRSLGRTSPFERPVRELIADPGRQPLVTFRIGHPQRAARRSPRRGLSEVTR